MKKILITGCRGGIGLDSAVALSKLGYKVYATVHREESVEELKTFATQQGIELEIFKLDITKQQDRDKTLDLNIDVLINNAAIGESGSLAEIPITNVRKNFETNVFGTLELTQSVLKKMIKKDSGKVIIISSLAGRMPIAFWGAYCMTKFSLSAAADIMRQELRLVTKNVNIIVVEPGTYATGFNQRVMNSKYAWMDKSSYFSKVIGEIKQKEEARFALFERKSNSSIVKKIVKAVEADKPRLRYTAPWWQAAGSQLGRIFGR